MLAILAGTPLLGLCSEGVAPSAEAEQLNSPAGSEEEHALPQNAVPITAPSGGLPITNSMIVTWIVAVGLIIFAQIVDPQDEAHPGGGAEFLGMDGRKPVRLS